MSSNHDNFDDDEKRDYDDSFHDGDDAISSSESLLPNVIAKRESRAVKGMRILVFSILLLTTIAVATLVFHYVSTAEQEQFKQEYVLQAEKLLQGIGTSLHYTLGGINTLVVSMVSFANATNQQWPYVTIPDFGVRTESVRSLTDAVYFMMYPYVRLEERYEWQNYTSAHGPEWVDEVLALQKREEMFASLEYNLSDMVYLDVIYDITEFSKPLDEQGKVGRDPQLKGPFLPNWQTWPLVPGGFPPYNWDLLQTAYNDSILAVLDTHKVSISAAYLIAYPNDTAQIEENIVTSEWMKNYLPPDENALEPISDIYYPILLDAAENIRAHSDQTDPTQSNLAGMIDVTFYWRNLIRGILPDKTDGIVVVFDSPCNPTFTYQVNGPDTIFLGTGDFHDSHYDSMVISAPLSSLQKHSLSGSSYVGIPVNDLCSFNVRIYPSYVLEQTYVTNHPAVFTTIAVMIFVFTSAVFLIYDWWVERRQKVVMHSAVRSDAIVSSLFPATVKDRLYTAQSVEDRQPKVSVNNASAFKIGTGNNQVNCGDNQEDKAKVNTLPIADLFPEASVLFADIAGFTAWSSSRDPTQVFFLLEKLFGAFDRIAKKRGVFKIETIGDCYVAVTGLPLPRRNHAIAMVRFAADLRDTMNALTRELEIDLGPGTGDLRLRVGVHSGPVTAGVLRGEKSRFQLFGDTVNTASRMESNGKPNYIHVSQKTADQLKAAGKKMWLTARETVIVAKGKGKMQTYWAEPHREVGDGTVGTSYHSGDQSESVLMEIVQPATKALQVNERDHDNSDIDAVDAAVAAKTDRFIEWNAALFEQMIQKLIAHRRALGQPESGDSLVWSPMMNATTVRDEIVLSVDLMPFRQAEYDVDAESITLPSAVTQQVYQYIAALAQKYRCNAFHNFEHACHVVMCAKKLLQQITTTNKTLSQQEIYIHTFGIATDPLSQLAVMFAALIHDVNHPGVPNGQLMKEDTVIAERYENKSVAEQNSVEIAWSLLMEATFADLRAYLFVTEHDLNRFRQLVVNLVLATDIFDPSLKAMRDKRWQDAFSESARSDDADSLNRKATIVLEHIMQASDVAHTMQHWSIYQDWNRRLFKEVYGAYQAGRADSDPSEGWYGGELWFFDNYVIPLAKKLTECRVFGSHSHELMDFACDNRYEWENKGEAKVEEMKEMFGCGLVEL